jgi:hypothetical protein
MEKSHSNPQYPSDPQTPSLDCSLLAELWRNNDHGHFLAVRDPVSGFFKSVHITDLNQVDETASKFDLVGRDVYHACACFREGAVERKAPYAIGAYGFWVDIDCGPAKAESSKGYADESQADLALTAFCNDNDLPHPNWIIHSGGGVHAYWIMDQLVQNEEWRDHAKKLKALAAKVGFLADPSRTADIASLLRVPGTSNHKYEPVRPVALVRSTDTRISVAVMLQCIDAAWAKHCGAVAATAKPVHGSTSVTDPSSHSEKDHGPMDMAQIKSALQVLNPDCDEATWKFHRVAVLAREALQHPEHADALKSLAREWSSGQLRGKPAKAWTTPGQSNGQTGEQVFDGVWQRFFNPSYTGKTATLGTVFYHAREAGWSYTKPGNELAGAEAVDQKPSRPTKKSASKNDAGPVAKSLFKEVLPADEPVDPAGLFSKIEQVIRTYIVLEQEQADAAALWVAHTYLIEALDISPLAIIDAPERACAKTLFQNVLALLSYRPLPAANASLAAMFRAIEQWGCTLFIDEADTFFKENKELQGVVNAGYKRGGVVLRAEASGDSYEPKTFSVYGPKSIAGIALTKHLPDSTMSRGIVFNMRRKLATEKVQRMRSAEAGLFDGLASQLMRFAVDYKGKVRDARPELPDALSDRSQDNWEPLLSIAQCAGDEWVRRAINAALKMSAASEAQGSASNDLLTDIREVLNSWTHSNIKSVDLIEKLCEDPEMGWATYYRGKPLTPRLLSKYLSAYNLKPRTVRQEDGSTPKGYYVDEFQDVFERYLKPLDVA